MKGKLAAVLLACAALAPAAWCNTVAAVAGDVRILRAGASVPAALGAAVQEGDEVVSAEGGEAIVRMDDGGRLAVRTSSRVLFRQLPAPGAPATADKLVHLVRGALRYVSSGLAGARSTRFETGTATIGIRGTDIEIAFTEQAVANEPPGTLLRVRTGLAFIRGSDGTQTDVQPGQVAFGGESDPPSRSIGTPRRPGARIVNARAASAFSEGALDAALR
jgi:hypothetical protein